MFFIKIVLVASVCVISCESRIHKRFSERHGLSRLMTDRNVPNPSDTSPKLDQVEQSVTSWPAARIVGDLTISGVTTGGSINSAATGTPANTTSTDPEASIGTVTDLQQALKEIQGQSNNGIAQLAGSTAATNMAIDLLKSKVTQFQTDVRLNFSRIDNTLNELGDSSVLNDVQSIKKTLFQLQSQMGSVAAGAAGTGVVQGLTQRLSDLGSTVSDLSQKVTALEARNNLTMMTQSAQAAESTTSDTTLSTAASLQFVLQSWTGRIALGGAVIGIVALVLSIIALSKSPKSVEAAPADTAGEEQVLMEAGEGEQVDETQAAGGEVEYYEEQEAQQ